MSALKKLVSILKKVFEWGAELSSALIFLMVLLVSADVFGRYALSKPIPGTYEISEALMIFIVFLAYAHTEATDQNIRIRLIERYITQRQKDVLDIFAYALGILIFGVICWQGWAQAMFSLEVGQRAQGLFRFPLAPVKFALVLGAFLLVVQFFIGFVSRIAKVLQRSSG